MDNLYEIVSAKCSKLTTNAYSTSFSLGILMLDKKHREAIYGIYGFVRLADEIVDTFHGYNKQELLADFKQQTFKAIDDKISLNPILHSFQLAVNKYAIDHDLIHAFLHSMYLDLDKSKYTQGEYEEYIYGSAEVVGLMCLKVFLNGDNIKYNELKPFARALGSAFQKINFLRDYKNDANELGRLYFPNLKNSQLNETTKVEIENDIEIDFDKGLEGIKKLPKGSRFGVYVAYIYYRALFNKVKSRPVNDILSERIRISDFKKFTLLFSAYFRHKLNLL